MAHTSEGPVTLGYISSLGANGIKLLQEGGSRSTQPITSLRSLADDLRRRPVA
jgi:hypothetical protein